MQSGAYFPCNLSRTLIEFRAVGKVACIACEDAGICWQTAELGAVDVGGGGTIAYICANYGMNVIDAGLPVLSMHAPWELISKVDLWMEYKCYCAFIKDAEEISY